MKKFLMATLATTAVSTAAQAGSISYDFRGDYQSATYNSAAIAAAPTKNADFNRFYFKIGRLDFNGNLNEDTSYRVRYAFYGTTAPSGGTRDNILNNVQLAYLTQKLGAGFSVTLGRVYSDIGGFEGQSSGAELYLVSEGYSHSFGSSKLSSRTFGTGDNNILYMSGVKANYTFADQTFSLMVLNPAQDETNGSGAFNQNQSAYGLSYKGAFLDKALSAVASYHELPGSNGPTVGTPGAFAGDDKTKFYTAGVKWDSKPVMVSAEYNWQEAKYAASSTTSYTDKLNSMVVKAAYTDWEQWTPRLEYTHTEETVDGATSKKNKFDGMGAVVEFKPRKEDNFRYHVAYQNIKETPDSGDNMTRSEVVVGARMMGDFLK